MRSTRWLIPASLSAVLLGLPGAPSGSSTHRDASASVLFVRSAEIVHGRGVAPDRQAIAFSPSERSARSANVVPVLRSIRHAVIRAQSPPRS